MSEKQKKFIVEIPYQKEEIKDGLDKRLDFHQQIITAVLIVVAVGFIAITVATLDIFIQHKRDEILKLDEYTKILTNYRDDITKNIQQTKLENQINQIQSEIDQLWKTKYPIQK